MASDGICPECNQDYTSWNWCKSCNSKHFQNDFNKWTSGNNEIDKFIQDIQLNADSYWEIFEWISYDRFKDVKKYVEQWKRRVENKVALKKFDNFVNFDDVLNEWINGYYFDIIYGNIP
ncbi:hypothetical protein Glove_114g87 [Diversispora epigaea]|uniref:Uncharacterized protein n=1 Tax=Diversispora epigaea TaxID=1348612 RepID=A0A397J3Y7_9GLOM|nr:hypothetical protein Glove_114g87 [Diversispora epigaea]